MSEERPQYSAGPADWGEPVQDAQQHLLGFINRQTGVVTIRKQKRVVRIFNGRSSVRCEDCGAVVGLSIDEVVADGVSV